MVLSNCFCLQAAQPAAEQPDSRAGQPASVTPVPSDAAAARPAQASRRKPATTREAPSPNDASVRKGVTFFVQKSDKVEPQASPLPGLEPQPSGRTAAAAAVAKSGSRSSTAISEATRTTSVATLSAGSAVSGYCFSDAEETDVAEADVDNGKDDCRPIQGCDGNLRRSRSRSRSRSYSRSCNSSRCGAVPHDADADADAEEDGDGDDGYDPDDEDDDDDDDGDLQDGADSRTAGCKTTRAATGVPSRSVAERARSNTSTWSVKVMKQLQLLPDQDGRLRLPSILAFTHRRPPRASRTQAWWTKVKGVLVVAGQSISAGGSSLGQSLRRRGTGAGADADTGGDSTRTRTAFQSRSQSLAPETDTENESYAYDGYGFPDSPAAEAGGAPPAAAANLAVGTAALTSQAAAVAEHCSTPGCSMGPTPPQAAGVPPASQGGARPNQERAGAAGPVENTPGSSWQPPLIVIDAGGGGREAEQRSLRPFATGSAGARNNLGAAAAAGALRTPGSLRPRSHPQLEIPPQPHPQAHPQLLGQAQQWLPEPPPTRTAAMDSRRASGWGADTPQHPAEMPSKSPLYGAGDAGAGGAACGAERPSRCGRRTDSGGRISGSGRSPYSGLPTGSGGGRDWGPVAEEPGWDPCNCSLPGQLHSPPIPGG